MDITPVTQEPITSSGLNAPPNTSQGISTYRRTYIYMNKHTLIHVHIHIYTYTHTQTYIVPSISFQTFFVWAFKIVVDSWTFSILLLYILWDDWPIFMISASNKQLQQQLEHTLLKPDCQGWWISKMHSGREDTLEERYAIKFCFKLGKMPQKRMECFKLLLDHLAWIEHQFLSSIRDSRKAGSLWGIMNGVGVVSKSLHQSWFGQRVRVRVTMLRF